MSAGSDRATTGRFAPVRLVAGREIAARLGSKAWRITTAALVLLTVGFAVALALLDLSSSTDRVGVLPPAAALGQAAGLSAPDAPVEVVPVEDAATGRAMVSAGDLDVLVLGVESSETGAEVKVVVDEELDPGLRTALTGAAAQSVLDEEITRLGGDPAAVTTRVAQSAVEVTALQPPRDYDPQRLLIGGVAGVLVYLALVVTGQSVATGVVEEKSTRVVELLLATLKPWQLMAGKVIGLGLVGLVQVALAAVAGIVAGELSGSLDLAWSTSVGLLVWLVIWFVVGFSLYALVFAGLGALVSRQEDVGGVTAPATVLLVLGYVAGISVLPYDPDNTAVVVMSMVPVFSPTLMPMRLAIGGVPAWQAGLSLALAVALIPLLVALTGRLYRNGVVRAGRRLSLREGLRRH